MKQKRICGQLPIPLISVISSLDPNRLSMGSIIDNCSSRYFDDFSNETKTHLCEALLTDVAMVNLCGAPLTVGVANALYLRWQVM